VDERIRVDKLNLVVRKVNVVKVKIVESVLVYTSDLIS